MTSAFTYTSDFHEQFAADLRTLLRRRFLQFAGVHLTLTSLMIPVELLARPDMGVVEFWAMIVGRSIVIALTAGSLIFAMRRGRPQEQIANLAFAIVFVTGLVQIARQAFDDSWTGIWSVFAVHTLAALFLPWSPAQAARVIGSLLLINAPVMLVGATDQSFGVRFGLVMLTPLVGVPGTIIAWLKHSRRLERFKLSFLQTRYGQMRRELLDARRIHEAVFPTPIVDGPVRFDYRYEPMRQIGGDYLFARCADGADGSLRRFDLVLLDVTGHGIAAALTVNRLHGEVERLYAENPDAGPGEILCALNRYVNLTLAKHSIYATAFCMSIDPEANELRYASGGHPPALIRAVDGTVEELDSTSFVLGACTHEEFQDGERSVRFGAGDAIISFTDGATEATGSDGKMFGVNGLLRVLLNSPPAVDGGWAQTIIEAVEAHRLGPPRDDTLIVEVYRPLPRRAQEPRPAVAAASAGT